jgi:hypothetical protein
MCATSEMSETIPESERVHLPGEKMILELRVYRQADGKVMVRWLSGKGAKSRDMEEAYQAVAKNAVDSLCLYASMAHDETKA